MLGLRLPKPNYFDVKCRERLDCSSMESLGGKASFLQNASVDRSFEREQGDVRLPSISSRAPEPQSVKHEKIDKLEKISNLRGAVKRSADGRSALGEAENKSRSRRPAANNIPLPRYGAINQKYSRADLLLSSRKDYRLPALQRKYVSQENSPARPEFKA